MRLKEFIRILERYPEDSENPQVIVQQLAVLAAVRAADKGQLPASCGKGETLDMDIIHAGILAGLERVHKFDGTIGDMRAFLYKTIDGTIRNYAWARENRIEDNHNTDISKVLVLEAAEPIDRGDDAAERSHSSIVLRDASSPDLELEKEQEPTPKTAAKALWEVFAYLGEEATALLQKDAQIGYNALKRREWAYSLGLTVGGLTTKLSRLRVRARVWALRQQ